MNIAILQVPLNFLELKQLSKEFPQLLFLSFAKYGQKIDKEYWRRTEVLYGSRITKEELEEASALRWIHVPTPAVNLIPIKDIESKGNILITNTPEENYFQVGEYVLSVVLAFVKNLFQWKEVNQYPALVWDCKYRNKMETLKDKIFLQIGLGKIGLEIARRAEAAGMIVWGMEERLSFHPYCKKSFIFSDLNTLLPEVDIVSLALPREKGLGIKMGNAEFSLMKEDSILSIVGTRQHLDEESLVEHAAKFRGISLDAYYQAPIPPQSKLWSIPNLLITPDIASRPKLEERESFRLFRYNLRQYLHGNYTEMKNLIDPSIAFVPELEEW